MAVSALSKIFILKFYRDMRAGRDAKLGSRVYPLIREAGLRAYQVGPFTLIEQNKKKTSRFAEMARKGAFIMWVIDRKLNKYLYNVINGKVSKLKRT